MFNIDKSTDQCFSHVKHIYIFLKFKVSIKTNSSIYTMIQLYMLSCLNFSIYTAFLYTAYSFCSIFEF